MIENILTTISKLKGVQHACLYRDGKDVLSTFPDNFKDITVLGQKMEQIFFGLQAVDKSHDEIYFSVEDKFMVAYLMYDSYIAILLTDKKINFPLIYMGIRSASSKIKRHVILHSEKTHVFTEQQKPSNPIEVFSASPPRLISPADEKLELIMSQLLEELINYFGPAAKFVFEDAIIQWETNYVKSRDNIPELGDILLNELDTTKEKNAFSQFVKKILK
jgi:predicted regulator of Ras-like GTPase activity (Roadblock/LC7/MglB family)